MWLKFPKVDKPGLYKLAVYWHRTKSRLKEHLTVCCLVLPSLTLKGPRTCQQHILSLFLSLGSIMFIESSIFFLCGQTAGKWLIAAEFKDRSRDTASMAPASHAFDELLNQQEHSGNTQTIAMLQQCRISLLSLFK